MKGFSLTALLLLTVLTIIGQNAILIGKVSLDGEELKDRKIEVVLLENNQFQTCDEKGVFQFQNLNPGKCTLQIFSENFQTQVIQTQAKIYPDTLFIKLLPFIEELETIEVQGNSDEETGRSYLKSVEGTSIYASKKNELIYVDHVAANKASNNTRQIYAKVPGIVVWENDGAGLQLGVGGRGLSPSRTSNFNVRQNGYDISADALGYPESYYTPSAEAVKRIEIVRGAASLQYGTQFGGLLNFKLKSEPDSLPIEIQTRQSFGSFDLYNGFTSLAVKKNKFKSYAYFQRKKGKDWRPNSSFDVLSAHSNIQYQIAPKGHIGFEFTHMNYLAQQAGGLTDFQFNDNPRQSVRERNWFKVNWNLAAIKYRHKWSAKSEYDIRLFGLIAAREAVGNLGTITRVDFLNSPRDLLKDDYLNWGLEQRFLKRYSIAKKTAVALVGMRFYNGETNRKQGDGTAEQKANFDFENESAPEDSKYFFPSQNLAIFAENVFYLSSMISITPGLRWEWINTEASGYYFNRSFNLAGTEIFSEQVFETRSNKRNFLLAGLGFSYKPNQSIELYANASQNYRSINFNDMRIVNANYAVDPNLTDEKGYSVDFGLRGKLNDYLRYDYSTFFLAYENRIGEIRITDPVLFRPIRYRTNIADSRSYGIETYTELSVLKLLGLEKKTHLDLFANIAVTDAYYIDSKESAINGNQVELVPNLITKYGLIIRKNRWKSSLQYAFTDKHFSDASNAEFTSNAVSGIIPAYEVLDFSTEYYWRHIGLEAGINNILNSYYFTRRAAGYPGPGIIPANPRTFYLTIVLKN